MKTHTVQSVADLIDRAGVLRESTDSSVFRGHADMSWSLASALFRGRARLWGPTEDYLVAEFKRFAWSLVPNAATLTFGDWLAIGRHHQLPTRLLDWSDSPLVAAWFAVSALAEVDGCVWVLEPTLRAGLSTFTDARKFDRLDDDTVVALEALTMDPRFRSQLGLFTADSIPEEDRPYTPLDEWASGSLTKLVISASLKPAFRRQLDRLGVDAFTVFPDLDGLGQHLGYRAGFGG